MSGSSSNLERRITDVYIDATDTAIHRLETRLERIKDAMKELEISNYRRFLFHRHMLKGAEETMELLKTTNDDIKDQTWIVEESVQKLT